MVSVWADSSFSSRYMIYSRAKEKGRIHLVSDHRQGLHGICCSHKDMGWDSPNNSGSYIRADYPKLPLLRKALTGFTFWGHQEQCARQLLWNSWSCVVVKPPTGAIPARQATSAARTSSARSCISAPTLTAAVAVNLNGSQTKSIFSMSLILIVYSEH